MTTPNFLSLFGMKTQLNIEALEDAGLLSRHAVQNEIAASEGGEHKTEESSFTE